MPGWGRGAGRSARSGGRRQDNTGQSGPANPSSSVGTVDSRPGVPGISSKPADRRVGNGRTRMTIESIFPDAAAMEQLLAMGQEEGLTEAVGQIDAILAENAVTSGPR